MMKLRKYMYKEDRYMCHKRWLCWVLCILCLLCFGCKKTDVPETVPEVTYLTAVEKPVPVRDAPAALAEQAVSADTQEALVLMQRFISSRPLEALEPVAQAQEVTAAAGLVTQCAVSEDIMRYMAAICEAARNPERVRLGPSPRALLALMRCAQALAAIRGRDYVIPDDVKELAVPVLAHRMVMRGVSSRTGAESFLTEVLKAVAVPTEQRL